MADFSYNNSIHSSTRHTPFEANYGYHPLEPSSHVKDSPTAVPASESHLTRLRELQTQLVHNLQAAQANHKRFFDHKVSDLSTADDTPRFQIGDMVFLNGRNVRSIRPSAKLDQCMLGHFQVIGTTPSPLAFRLDFPDMAIHPVFHVNLLEPVRPGHVNQRQDPPPRIEVDGELEYFIDRIIGSRFNSTTHASEYLVHWRGYPDSENSWEPSANLSHTSVFKSCPRERRTIRRTARAQP